MSDIFALVDCNNFYVSCERLFAPSIRNSPVVVLSNNDGCVIARSDEAKLLGIGMGVPVFEIGSLIETHQVQVFSTNYALYGNLSQRVMQVLASDVPDLEIYSIDEAFLDLSAIPYDDLPGHCFRLKEKIFRETGIPVSIGVGPSKTLAKAANHLAKTRPDKGGVLSLSHQVSADKLLHEIPVEHVWGVGEKYCQFFHRSGIFSALDLKQANPYHIRNHLGVPGQRLVVELNGKACYQFDDNPELKKEICTSRSFGHPLSDFAELEEATTSYASKVARKLRDRKMLARTMLVFVMTNKFSRGPQYVNYEVAELPVAANDTPSLVHQCRLLLNRIYRKGYRYKKSGVIVSELVPDEGRQKTLWQGEADDRMEKLMRVMDRLNTSGDHDLLKFAVQGNGSNWKMRQHNLSPRYTTKWKEILTVDLDGKQEGMQEP